MFRDIAYFEYMFIFKYHQSFEDASTLYEELKASAGADVQVDKNHVEDLLAITRKLEDRAATAIGILTELREKSSDKTKIAEIEEEIERTKNEIIISREYMEFAENILKQRQITDSEKGE